MCFKQWSALSVSVNQDTVSELGARKRQTAQRFDRVASTYARGRSVRVCAGQVVELAELQAGERVLDVGAGTGLAAMPAAEIVGLSGLVVAVDLAEGMLRELQAERSRAALRNLEVVQADAEQLPIRDGSLDVVLAASVIFFLPDPAAALREWLRVLVPGGRVLFSVWGEGFNQPEMGLFHARLESFGVAGGGNIDERLRQPAACRAMLTDAGFVDVDVTVEQHGYFRASAAEYWQELVESVNGVALTRLSVEQLARLRQAHCAEVQALATEQGIWRNVPIVFASGRRP